MAFWEGRRGSQVPDPGPVQVPRTVSISCWHLLLTFQCCVLSTEKGGRCSNKGSAQWSGEQLSLLLDFSQISSLLSVASPLTFPFFPTSRNW